MNQAFNINIEIKETQEQMLHYLQKHWKIFTAEGIFFIILGSIAIIVPQVFTVGIALFLGWLLLIGGAFQAARALMMINMPSFSLWFFISILQLLIGYFLVTDTMQGVMTLTLLLTVFFALEGLVKIYLAFMMRPLAKWGWVLFSGITALFLAILVWVGWPETATWVLGLLLGINMIFLGWSILSLSMQHKPSV